MTARLNALAIALQGIGFGSLQVALQGLLPIDDTPIPPDVFTMDVGGEIGRYIRRKKRRRREEQAFILGRKWLL